MTVPSHPFPPVAATRWTLDLSSTVHGRFARLVGDVELDADGAGRAALRIEAASVDTGITPVAVTIRACLKRAA